MAEPVAVGAKALVIGEAVALHAAAEHGAVEHAEGGEQRGDPVPQIVVGHGPGLAGLQRQTGLRAIERLDLRFLVDRMLGRSTYRPTMLSSLAANSGSVERLKVRM